MSVPQVAAALALGIEWSRPSGLLLLGPAALLLLLARRSARPVERVTATFDLWEDAMRRIPPAPRTRRLPPLPVVFAAVAITCAALALAGPRIVGSDPPRVFTILCDRSPSTSLPLQPGRTRFEVALEACLSELARRAGSTDRVRWRSQDRETLELPVGVKPPASWFARPAAFLPEIEWEREDRPGFLWVTDRVPTPSPSHALVFASGGRGVPGPVASRGGERVVWREGGLRVEPAPGRVVELRGVEAGRLGPLARLLTIWARERGFELRGGQERERALLIEAGRGAGETRELRIAGGSLGWGLAGTGGAGGIAELPEGAQVWRFGEASGGEAPILVAGSPGRVLLAFDGVRSVEGDPALFALAWSRFLDRWVLPAPGVVPLDERRDAGAASWDEWSEDRFEEVPRVGAGRGETTSADLLAPALAGIGVLFATLAILLSGGGISWLRGRLPASRTRT
ncbi:MAG TPA: hypothetical protein ENJ09_15650 [Planctomycetes bacterium]|nr:hypothetical protein [Planctomycetota bacterium]